MNSGSVHPWLSPGLRARVVATFAALSIAVAIAVSAGTYALASWYLPSQREASALTRAALDARAVGAALGAGAPAGEALQDAPSVGSSQTMLLVDGSWFTAAVSITPDALPAGLLDRARRTGAEQRVQIAGEPYYIVAIPVPGGLFVEVFPLRDLDRILTLGSLGLVGLTILAGAMGAIAGSVAVRRLLRPVGALSGAALRIAAGDLGTRVPTTVDPDLAPIADSFNTMATAVEQRIERERRFAANVSHELRSPMTTIMGMAEVLESQQGRLPEDVAAEVRLLASQVRRLRSMVVDLLEMSRPRTAAETQEEWVDVRRLTARLLAARGLEEVLEEGSDVTVLSDPRRLERIVANIIDNAELHAGGLTRASVSGGDAPTIELDDAGPGIEAAIGSSLFEPFVRGTAAPPGSGAGLGLAIAREHADAIGARISFAPLAPTGTRFRVVLPARDEDSP